MHKKRLSLLTVLAISSSAFATELRIYPSFAEVQQPVTLTAQGEKASYDAAFPMSAWQWIQAGSLSLAGAALSRLQVQPADLDWLSSQEGRAVIWRRPGQEAVEATLIRASDLLLKLNSGEYVNAGRNELGFKAAPPRDWVSGGVRAHFEVTGKAQNVQMLYRTAALSWRPRYELGVVPAGAALSALAEIRNVSEEDFKAEKVDLFAGDVRQVNMPYAVQQIVTANQANVSSAVATMPTAGKTGTGNVGLDQITSVGEVRGLQRYALPGPLALGRGESLTLPFLKPAVKDFGRYASVQSYFDMQAKSGKTNRHYKFTPDLSMPTGAIDVRENGLLIGTVPLASTQAGKSVDLDLGNDPELRYQKAVKRLSQEKDAQGRPLSTTYQVTYTFTSTKTAATRVRLREQMYARNVVVDDQPAGQQQVTVERRVDVPAGGSASITFKLKLMN